MSFLKLILDPTTLLVIRASIIFLIIGFSSNWVITLVDYYHAKQTSSPMAEKLSMSLNIIAGFVALLGAFLFI
jgi:uncharacterized membrane protein